MKLKRFLGNKSFYKRIMLIAVPIMVQNGITNFVSLLDNIMVGRIGTEQMSGVAIINQLVFIYYLMMFGGLSGVGIFTAQYFGKQDMEGIRHTFRYKLWMSFLVSMLALVLFLTFQDSLIQMYLHKSSDGGNLHATYLYARRYVRIIFFSIPPLMLQMVYASSLRECGETVLPMKAGITAVLVNLVLNYILIYGKFGAPKLGVAGAAIATVSSRYVEAAIVLTWVHTHKEKNPYMKGMYRTLKVPFSLVKAFFLKGAPLFFNEALWSIGMAFLIQCYSYRGLNVVASMNIANTINNIFNIAFFAMGDAIAIIVGQLLGANKMKEAKDTAYKIIAFAVMISLCVAVLMSGTSTFFPRLYKTNAAAKRLATRYIIVNACFMPIIAFLHTSYFTLRSGGKTVITFLFDSVFVWSISIPFAYILSRFTQIPAVQMYVMVQSADLIKCVLGFILVKKGVWMQNIVEK